MFQPNILCSVARVNGRTDLFGNATLAPAVPSMCSIVKLITRESNVTVRADSSASRGAAQESTAEAVLLFSPAQKVAINDVVDVIGYRLKVTAVHPRISINGRLDHYQIEAMIWA